MVVYQIFKSSHHYRFSIRKREGPSLGLGPVRNVTSTGYFINHPLFQIMLTSLGDGSDTKDNNKIVVLAHDR